MFYITVYFLTHNSIPVRIDPANFRKTLSKARGAITDTKHSMNRRQENLV